MCVGVAVKTCVGLAGWEAAQLGHVVLDDEGTPGWRCFATFLKHVDLLVLAREVGDRVTQQVDEAERCPSPVAVAKSPSVTPMLERVLGSQLQ